MWRCVSTKLQSSLSWLSCHIRITIANHHFVCCNFYYFLFISFCLQRQFSMGKQKEFGSVSVCALCSRSLVKRREKKVHPKVESLWTCRRNLKATKFKCFRCRSREETKYILKESMLKKWRNFEKEIVLMERLLRETEDAGVMGDDAVGRWFLTMSKFDAERRRRRRRRRKDCAEICVHAGNGLSRSFCFSCLIYEILFMNCRNFVYVLAFFSFYTTHTGWRADARALHDLLFLYLYETTFLAVPSRGSSASSSSPSSGVCHSFSVQPLLWWNVKDVLTSTCVTNWCQKEATLTAININNICCATANTFLCHFNYDRKYAAMRGERRLKTERKSAIMNYSRFIPTFILWFAMSWSGFAHG